MASDTIDLTQIPPKPGGVLNLPDPDSLRAPARTTPETVTTAAPGSSPYVEDPATAAFAEPSDLDLMERELEDEINTLITIPFTERPGYAVRYKANISQAELEHFRKQATARGKVNGAKLDLLILSNKAIEILRQDKVLVDDEGQPLNFRHRGFIQRLDKASRKTGGPAVTSAAEAVKAFYQLDGIIDSTSNKVLAVAGWGSEQEEQSPDPTSGD